jgi:hypothetical protein
MVRITAAIRRLAVKWVGALFFMAGIAGLVWLWKEGFVEKFLGPWAAWSKWIGYFQ